MPAKSRPRFSLNSTATLAWRSRRTTGGRADPSIAAEPQFRNAVSLNRLFLELNIGEPLPEDHEVIENHPSEASGFILTTLLEIVGAFVATYLGQAVGWYKAGESAGFIGAIVGAIIVLVGGG